MTKAIAVLILGLFAAMSANAQEQSFFTDPSLLEPWDQGTFDVNYTHPDAVEIIPRYNSVLVDQPEIFIAKDSKYKGAKPDHLKQLVDTARRAMVERLEAGNWPVADAPGPGVIYMRWAISDLYLKKKKRGILSYTPVGMVVHETRQAAIRDLWKKIDIVELDLKVEWTDAETGEVLGAGMTRRGARKTQDSKAVLVSWEELDALFLTIGEQMRCHLDNKKLPEGKQRLDCDSILIEPEVTD